MTDREPEPVAWMRSDKGHIDFHKHPDYIPLYTALPQREWQGLTDEDIWELVQKTPDFRETVAAVEEALRRKNT